MPVSWRVSYNAQSDAPALRPDPGPDPVAGARSRIRQAEPATGPAAVNPAVQPATNLREAVLAAIDDDAAGRIVRSQRDRDLVAEHDANAVLAQLAAKMGEDLVAILQLDLEIARWQDLDHAALEFYVFFSTHRGGTEVTR